MTIKFLIIKSDVQFKQITIKEVRNIHMYSSFCLVALPEENSRKPLLLVTYKYLFVFSFLTKEQKRFEVWKSSITQFLCMIHIHTTCITMISSKM